MMKAPMDLDFIDDWLAVGGRVEEVHGPELEERGIRRVIDLRAEVEGRGPVLAPWHVERLHLPTFDLAAPSLAHIDAGVAWALEAKRNGHRVLVHCEHGIGRSAVVACACLIALGDSPLEALTRAKDRRERVAPSPVQLEALIEWARGHRERAGRTLVETSWEDLAKVSYRHLLDS